MRGALEKSDYCRRLHVVFYKMLHGGRTSSCKLFLSFAQMKLILILLEITLHLLLSHKFVMIFILKKYGRWTNKICVAHRTLEICSIIVMFKLDGIVQIFRHDNV